MQKLINRLLLGAAVFACAPTQCMSQDGNQQTVLVYERCPHCMEKLPANNTELKKLYTRRALGLKALESVGNIAGYMGAGYLLFGSTGATIGTFIAWMNESGRIVSFFVGRQELIEECTREVRIFKSRQTK